MYYLARIKESDNKYQVTFPDFPSITAQSSSFADAQKKAEDLLNAFLEAELEDNDLPKAGSHKGRDLYEVYVRSYIEVSYLLKKARKNRTQHDIAEDLGVTRQAYQKFEIPRKCNPTIKTLERLCTALGKRLEVRFK